MILRFPHEGVARLIAHTRACTSFNPNLAEKVDQIAPKAALWLVGDQGVYLMSNGKPELRDGDKAFVVYAREVDPTKLPFEEWWAAKRASFGGDDGCGALPLEKIEAVLMGGLVGDLHLDVTEAGVSIMLQRPSQGSKPNRSRSPRSRR